MTILIIFSIIIIESKESKRKEQTKMKDYKISVTNDDINRLLFNGRYNFDVDIVQGCLNDNYFIDGWNLGIKFSRGRSVKPRKHLMILESYLNEWTSELTLILTDNDKKYFETKRNFLSDYLKDNKKENFLDNEEKSFFKDELKECVKQLGGK